MRGRTLEDIKLEIFDTTETLQRVRIMTRSAENRTARHKNCIATQKKALYPNLASNPRCCGAQRPILAWTAADNSELEFIGFQGLQLQAHGTSIINLQVVKRNKRPPPLTFAEISRRSLRRFFSIRTIRLEWAWREATMRRD